MEPKELPKHTLTLFIPILFLIAILHEIGYYWALKYSFFPPVSLSSLTAALLPKTQIYILTGMTIAIFLVSIYLLYKVTCYFIKQSPYSTAVQKIFDNNYVLLTFGILFAIIGTSIISLMLFVTVKDLYFSIAVFVILLLWFLTMVSTVYLLKDPWPFIIYMSPVAVFGIMLIGYSESLNDLNKLQKNGSNAHLIMEDGTRQNISLIREYDDILVILENGNVATWSKANVQAVVHAPFKSIEAPTTKTPSENSKALSPSVELERMDGGERN